MHKIVGKRGSGKTTKLLEIACKNNYIIVEPTRMMANYVAEMAKERGYSVQIISADEFLRRRIGYREHYYLIDELDMFLMTLGVKGYSVGDDSW